ncbi:hypothetical protein ELH80_13795 [Rhizobium ruizarguesonis]|uniref:hypothetical protein n=1 Tax=Rhizobium ruizarguesonis TaxID=2081791 RepID=UPI001032026A|nr:hypothetical protein [Rhizobium ruizarguesonis]TAZ35368.1 hypothetical protein ELH80_13795 [Rhizobium ruizarguesonis]
MDYFNGARSGIHYNNEVFHEPNVTTSLLHDLYYLNTRSRKAENNGKSVAVTVEIIVFDEDASVIAVYNPARRSYVRLPNRNPDVRGSYDQRAQQRAIQDHENNAWFSFDELAINEARHSASLSMKPLPSLPDRSNSSPVPMPLVGAADVEVVERVAHNSPRELPVHSREDNVPPRKIARRGEAKAAQTRRRKDKQKKAEAQAKPRTLVPHEFDIDPSELQANVADLSSIEDAFEVTDLGAYRQSLKSRLKLSRGK